MQSQMQFFEVLPRGVGQSVQKVAVKMPAGGISEDAEAGGFADIMAALMNLPADQLRQSLAQLDRVCVEGQSKEWVPLLDLTQATGASGGMLKLLQADSQANQTAASMLQLKLQQMQTQDISAQPEAEVLPEANPLDAKSPSAPEAPAAGDLQAEMAAFFESVQTDGEELPNQSSTKDSFAELARALNGREPQTDTAEEPTIDSLPGLTDKTKNSQANQMGQMPAKNPDDLTALQKQATADGKSAFAAAVEKKAAASRRAVAAAKAAPAAAAQAAAKSAVTEQPDMSASLDKALSQQRPIQKEEAPVAEGRLQAQTEIASGTPQTLTAPDEPLQSVESRLKGVETRTVQHAKETSDLPSASKEMQTDVVRQIVQRMTLRSDGRNTSMQIKLKPEHLGNLRMEVVAENQQVTVRMTAENQAVKGIIEQNLHVLKNELQQHGLQIQKFDVFVSQDNDAWRNGQQQTAFRQAQDHGYRSGNGRNGRFAENEESSAVEGATGASRAYGEKSSVDFFA